MNIGWFTGLFEGEGCIYKDPRCNSIRLTLNSTDYDVVARFFNMAQCGYLRNGNHVERNKHRKPFWVWTVWKKADVKRLLVQMLPLLGERRAYTALNALDVIDGVY